MFKIKSITKGLLAIIIKFISNLFVMSIGSLVALLIWLIFTIATFISFIGAFLFDKKGEIEIQKSVIES